jgi:site-specific recombinase XerD
LNRKEKALEWLKQFETGRRWISTVQAEKTGSLKTQLEYAYRLRKFCLHVNRNPDQLIEDRKNDLKAETEVEQRKTEELVRDFFNLQAEKSTRLSAKAYHGALRSFYKYNYMSLRMETPRARSRKIQPITLEEFKQIDAIANPRDRALLRFMKDSGLSTEDVVVFNYGDIKREFEEGNEFIHIRAVRQKTQVNYDTFIGPNAVEALRTYFQLRKANGETLNDKSPLFLSHGKRKGKKRGDVERLDDNSVRTIFTRLKNRIGIIVSPHRIRKLFASYMGLKVRHPAILKYWMGHSVETSDVEGRYVLPPLEEQRKLYMESYEQIDIRPKPSLTKDEARAEAVATLPDELLEPLAKKHGLTLEQYRRILREKKAPTSTVPLIPPQTNEKDTCKNGNCQRVIAENELEVLLAQGWRVAAVLPSGKIVVSNE